MAERLVLRTTKSKIYALFLSILPVIMVYKTPGLDIGLSTLFIIVFLIHGFAAVVCNMRKIEIYRILPIVLYLLYMIFKNSGMEAFLPIIILIHIVAFSTGAANEKFLRLSIETISVAASICLLIQVLVHAVFEFHIPMINSNLILDSLSVYQQPIKTGYSVIEKMYRPSAFFLEPSHFTQYCIVGLGSSLFRFEKKISHSILITLGIIFTTSGLGFVLVFVMWSWWYISNNDRRLLLRNKGRIITIAIVVPILIIIISKIPFFGSITSRFLTPESYGNYNAIAGRLFWWDTYFGSLSWKDLIVGFGADKLPDIYFTGFMTVLYAYGIIGVALLIFSYLTTAIKGKTLARTLSLMYIGLFFMANLINMISLIFSFGTIMTIYSGKQTSSGNG